MNAHKNKILLWFLLFFSATALADNTLLNNSTSHAVAQPATANAFSNHGGDVSLFLIKILFGGMPNFGGGADAFGDIIGVFNRVVLSVAGVVACYVLLMQIYASRHGEMSRQVSNTVTTVKNTIGVAFLMPLVNGYSLIHILFMYLCVGGIQLSNFVWGKFASSDTLTKTLSIAPPTPNAKHLSRDLLVASLCMEAVRQEALSKGDNMIKMGWTINSGDNQVVLSDFKKPFLAEMVKNNPTKKLILKAGSINGASGIATNACGSITITPVDDSAWGKAFNHETAIHTGNAVTAGVAAWQAESPFVALGSAAAGVMELATGVSKLWHAKKDFQAWIDAMKLEHASATQKLMERTDEIAKNIITHSQNALARETRQKAQGNVELFRKQGFTLDEKPTTMSKEQIVMAIDALASQYMSDFRTKAAETYKNGEALKTMLKLMNEYGWAVAGFAFPQMASLNDSINQIALNVPQSTSNFSSPQATLATEYNSRYLSKANQYLELTNIYKNDGFLLPNVNKTVQESLENNLAHQNSAGSLFMWLEDWALSQVNNSISDYEHPIIQMKRLGSLMLSAGSNIFMLAMSQSVSSNSLMTMVAFALITSLISCGIMLAYILPLWVSFSWLGMFIGWLFMVVEIMFTVTIFSLTFMARHGDDFVGNQQKGLVMILSMTLRPTMMVIGVIAMVVMLILVGIFINSFFTMIYGMVQVGGSGVANIFLGLFLAPIMYTVMVYVCIRESLQFMHLIPDRIFQLYGDQGHLSHFAEKMNHGNVQAFGAVFQTAAGSIGSPAQQMRHLGGSGGFKGFSPHNPNGGGSSGGTGLGGSGGFLPNWVRQQFAKSGGTASQSSLDGNPFSEVLAKPSVGSAGSMGMDTHNNAITGYGNEQVVKAIQAGKLGKPHEGVADLAKAKEGLYPATQNIKDKAVENALGHAHDHWRDKKTPMDYQQFVDYVNNSIQSQTLGGELHHQMNEHANNLSHFSKGDPKDFLRKFHQKVHHVAQERGISPNELAPKMANNILQTSQAFASANGGGQWLSSANSPSNYASHPNNSRMQTIGKSLANVNTQFMDSPHHSINYQATKREIAYSDRVYGYNYQSGSVKLMKPDVFAQTQPPEVVRRASEYQAMQQPIVTANQVDITPYKPEPNSQTLSKDQGGIDMNKIYGKWTSTPTADYTTPHTASDNKDNKNATL